MAKSNLLSERINSLSESQTIGMANKARELRQQGHDVISLNLGEPDFGTPQHIKDAAKEAIDAGYTFYTPVPGIPELRQGIADKLKTQNNIDTTPDCISVSTGAKQSLANVILSLVNPGDEVIVFTPYWVTYAEQIKLAEGTPVYLEGTIANDFKVTAEQLKEAITPKTKAIIYSSPCNPTGSVFTKEELTAIADVVAAEDDLFIIADEIYEHINFTGKHFSIGSLPQVKDRTITVNGFAKGFAMTGWRIGYIAAPLWITKACNKLQGQVTSGTCSIAQYAAVAGITGDMTPTEEMAKTYLRRRDLVISLLNEIDGIKTNTPQGAFYIFPDVSSFFGKSDGEQTIETSYDLCMYLLNKAHVSLVDGSAFGSPDCLRLSYAASDENLIEAVKRMKEALALLK